MSTKFNDTTLTDVIYNGVSLMKVVFNGTVVFIKELLLSLDGTFSTYAQKNRLFNFNGTSIDAHYNESSYYEGRLTYNDPIDLTPFKTLTVGLYLAGINSSTYSLKIGVSKNKITTETDQSFDRATTISKGASTGERTVTIDVSDLNGEYYFSLYLGSAILTLRSVLFT